MASDEEWQQQLDALRKEHRIEREHDRLRHQEHALGLIIENEALREKNRLLTKRATRLKARVDDLKDALASNDRELRSTRETLDALYASRTWRTGRALTRPARSLRR